MQTRRDNRVAISMSPSCREPVHPLLPRERPRGLRSRYFRTRERGDSGAHHLGIACRQGAAPAFEAGRHPFDTSRRQTFLLRQSVN